MRMLLSTVCVAVPARIRPSWVSTVVVYSLATQPARFSRHVNKDSSPVLPRL